MKPTLSPDAIASSAQYLWRCRVEGRETGDLPAGLRPTTREEGYAVHAAAAAHPELGPCIGWKIAATSQAGQRHIGVSGPLAGRMFERTQLADGQAVSLTGNAMRVAEIEIAFTLQRTLDETAGPAPLTTAQVAQAVAAVRPAIEVPNARFAVFTTAGEAQLIADGACAHQVLIGPPLPPDERMFHLADHAVHALLHRDGGTQRHDGTGRNALGDPLVALTWIANELRAHGAALRAGDTVITGTCVVPVAVQPGDRIEGDWGWLGRLSLQFTA